MFDHAIQAFGKMMKEIESFKNIIGNLTTSIIVLDDELCALYMNSSAEVLLGISAARLAPKPIQKWLTLSVKEQGRFEQVLIDQAPYTIREATICTIKGQELTIDYSVSFIEHDGRSCLLLEIQGRDRLLRIEKEEELLERHLTTRNLVRGMAHEIKNPLGGIRGAAQLLERQLETESLQEYTQVIIDEADRLRDLVDKLLGPRTLPDFSLMNVHSVLERVFKLTQTSVSKGIELQRDYDPSIPDILGDRGQLIQAVLNITLNAVQSLNEKPVDNAKITFRTRTKRQVTLGANKHKLVCLIEVIDNGFGIEKSMMNSMFFPMITSRADGSGLGLSISQAILNQHNGLIECSSRQGETVFSLWLPITSNSTI